METEGANLFSIVGGNVRRPSERKVGNDPKDRYTSGMQKRLITPEGELVRLIREVASMDIHRTLTDQDYTFDPELKADIDKYEIEKTEKHKVIIRCANVLINEVRDRYGLPLFDLPVENIRFVDHQFFSKRKLKYRAYAVVSKNLIVIDFKHSGVFELISAIIHEMIHLVLSRNAFQVKATLTNDSLEPEIIEYRSGIRVFPSHSNFVKTDQEYRGFEGLDEVEVEFLTKRFFIKIFNFEELKEEAEIIKSTKYQTERDRIAGICDLDQNDLFATDETLTQWLQFHYPIHRQVLGYIKDEITKSTGMSLEEVEDLFEEALVTGKLLKISKLIKKVFGQDGFKVVVSMTDQDQSAKDVLIKLKEIRLKEKEF